MWLARTTVAQSPTRSSPQSTRLRSNPLPYPPTTSKYSSHSHPNGNTFVPRRRASYYISQPTPLDFEEEDDDSIIIVRAVVYVIFLVALALSSAVVTTKVLTTPILPQIRVVSLSVTNFTVSSESGMIKANWNVTVQVFNPNNRFKAEMNKIDIYVNYKGVTLLRAEGRAFKMEQNKNHSLRANLLRKNGNGTEYHLVENEVVKEMEKDRKSGAVSFGLVMEMGINYDVDGVVNREYYAKGACEGLKVRFKTAATRSGKFINGMHCTSHR
ncbi:hypothetical protein L1049_017694 [Liquidambar formosana]|uniref:Late embryogenesis abundant protein LEA-2 subgroup domain-containing protein n=1 Tax=Liquidambar formosana TaxID=63359 RepID=A0AAP0S844_LIQFO